MLTSDQVVKEAQDWLNDNNPGDGNYRWEARYAQDEDTLVIWGFRLSDDTRCYDDAPLSEVDTRVPRWHLYADMARAVMNKIEDSDRQTR